MRQTIDVGEKKYSQRKSNERKQRSKKWSDKMEQRVCVCWTEKQSHLETKLWFVVLSMWVCSLFCVPVISFLFQILPPFFSPDAFSRKTLMLFTVIFIIIYSALLLIERQTNDEKCVFSVAPRQTIIHSSQHRVRAVCIHQWDYVLRSTLLFYAIVHHLPFILSLLLSRSLALARLQCYYFLWSSFLRWRLFNLLNRKNKTSISLAFLIVWHCLPSLIHLSVAQRQESIYPYGFLWVERFGSNVILSMLKLRFPLNLFDPILCSIFISVIFSYFPHVQFGCEFIALQKWSMAWGCIQFKRWFKRRSS